MVLRTWSLHCTPDPYPNAAAEPNLNNLVSGVTLEPRLICMAYLCQTLFGKPVVNNFQQENICLNSRTLSKPKSCGYYFTVIAIFRESKFSCKVVCV